MVHVPERHLAAGQADVVRCRRPMVRRLKCYVPLVQPALDFVLSTQAGGGGGLCAVGRLVPVRREAAHLARRARIGRSRLQSTDSIDARFLPDVSFCSQLSCRPRMARR
jgi:hypothetical protein